MSTDKPTQQYIKLNKLQTDSENEMMGECGGHGALATWITENHLKNFDEIESRFAGKHTAIKVFIRGELSIFVRKASPK